jgi:hypothetical protein
MLSAVVFVFGVFAWVISRDTGHVGTVSVAGPGLAGTGWWVTAQGRAEEGILSAGLEWGRFDTDKPPGWKADADYEKQGIAEAEDSVKCSVLVWGWQWEFERISGPKGSATPELWRLEAAWPAWAMTLGAAAILIILIVTRAAAQWFYRKQRLSSAVCLHCGRILKTDDPPLCPGCNQPRPQVTVSKAERRGG